MTTPNTPVGLAARIVAWLRRILCQLGWGSQCAPQLAAHPSGLMAQLSAGAGVVQPVLPPHVHPILLGGSYPGAGMFADTPPDGAGHRPLIPRTYGVGGAARGRAAGRVGANGRSPLPPQTAPVDARAALRLLNDPAFTAACCTVNGVTATEEDFRAVLAGDEPTGAPGEALAAALLEVLDDEGDLAHVLALSRGGDRGAREAALGLLVAEVARTKVLCEGLAADAAAGDAEALDRARSVLQSCHEAPHLLENQVAERCLRDALAMGEAATAGACDAAPGDYEGEDALYDAADLAGEEAA